MKCLPDVGCHSQPGWWHGVVGNASLFMRRSYSTPCPVST